MSMEWNKYIKEYKAKNRDKLLAQERARYHKQSDEKKKANVLKNKKRRQRLKIEAIEHYGAKCQCCGEKQFEFLCIDHINGGGNQHRKTMGTKSIGEWLYSNNYPKGFQVLCHNCNMAKSIYQHCPHQI